MLCALVDFVHPPVHWDSITAHTWRQNHYWQPNGAQWNLPNQQTLSSNCKTSNKLGHHTILVKAYYNIWGVLGDPKTVGYPQNNFTLLSSLERSCILWDSCIRPSLKGDYHVLLGDLVIRIHPRMTQSSTCSILPRTTDFAKNIIPWLVLWASLTKFLLMVYIQIIHTGFTAIMVLQLKPTSNY